MENTDRELIFKVIQSNAKLRRLYDEHMLLEKKLSSYERRSFLTPHEELEQKRLKRLKLFGVDRMMEILADHRVSA